jgi:ubiquinone/menaquinone biosynthesis C-methylase UbiE
MALNLGAYMQNNVVGDPTYLHGASDSEQLRLARRTAATSAAFFLPHLRPGMRLLDCGCGVGSITLGLAEAITPGEAIGIDIQPEQVARARATAAERGIANVRFEVAPIDALPFPDAVFDAAFASTVLMHLPDPLRALQELKRVLKPGGVVGITDDDHDFALIEPAVPEVIAAHRLLMRVIEHYGGNPSLARHHRRLLREAGFARPVAGATTAVGGAWGTPEETRALALWWSNQLRQPDIATLITTQGWADQSTFESQIAAVLAWGEHPDALFTVLGVTAVGWKDA